MTSLAAFLVAGALVLGAVIAFVATWRVCAIEDDDDDEDDYRNGY